MDIICCARRWEEQRLISSVCIWGQVKLQYINKMEKSYVEIDSSVMKESIHERLNANMEKQRQKHSPMSMTE